ncbi:Flp family type IVb pilin [Hyphomicrobium sp.]|uniref:Flp family type IVb pilin n=1 Tax=Hyphomicrobium sp. TaxID=82 RepID=UPI002C0C63AA|nr:Flp family type IVb pilin [Hyphomicrobium sp.]HRN87063.1 Flp family type IVb pilin [Hyphomicrobium sp.]HRQ26381.1 Flp family type IVb pilin [Hyphomicrobium sp.]
MQRLMKSFWADRSGATSIEYALIAMIVGVGIIASLQLFFIAVEGLFTDVSNEFAKF